MENILVKIKQVVYVSDCEDSPQGSTLDLNSDISSKSIIHPLNATANISSGISEFSQTEFSKIKSSDNLPFTTAKESRIKKNKIILDKLRELKGVQRK